MDNFSTEAFTLLGVGLLVIGLRTYMRLRTVGIAGFQADDYLMLLAACVYSVETYLAYSVGAIWHGLANNGMTDEERRLLDPSGEEHRLRIGGSRTQLAGWSTYTLLLWTLKAAMCTFYIRLTDGLHFRSRIYIGFVLIFTSWLAVVLSILLGCLPFEKNWQVYPDPGNNCQPAVSNIDIFVTVVLNVVTDAYLLTIPIPMLWGARLRPAKKAALIVLFSGGIFVMAAGILRCVLIVKNPVTGAQQAGSWAVRETFVAVITTNLPIVFPLVRGWLGPVFTNMWSYPSRVLKSSGGAHESYNSSAGVFALKERNPRRGQGPQTLYPIPDTTSEEGLCRERG